jgi:hypothetical protein
LAFLAFGSLPRFGFSGASRHIAAILKGYQTEYVRMYAGMTRTSAMASLMGAPGCESFHSFMWACTKRLYALGARFGLSSLSGEG